MPPLALIVVALALRLYNLGHESLWLDEGYTLLFSQMPFPKLILVGGAHEHPPLYYSIIHVVLALHNNYLMPRIVSAIVGAAGVGVLYLLGTRLGGRTAGIVAAVLLAVSPFQVWYSQDGRGYELAGLLVLLSYVALLSALDQPRKSLWFAYGLSLALCLYAEYTTALVLLPQVLLWKRARERGLTRPLTLSWVGAVLLFAPWVGTLALDALGIAGDYWIPPPTAGAVGTTALEFLGVTTPCSSPPCTGHELPIPGLAGHEAAVALLAGAVVGAGVLGAIRRRSLTLTLLLAWMMLPFVIVLIMSAVRSLYLDRVFLDATYPLYLLAGLLVAAAGTRRVAGVLAAVLITAVGIANLPSVYAGGVNPDWKLAARDFGAAYRPGQAVLFFPGVLRTLVGSYLPPGWHATREVPLWSGAYVDVAGWQHRYPAAFHLDRAARRRLDARLRNIQLAEVSRREQQVWLITYDYSGLNDTRRWFSEHGFEQLLSELYRGDTRIELWARSGPARYGHRVLSPDEFPRGWIKSGHVTVRSGSVSLVGRGALQRSIAVRPGVAYSVTVRYRGTPPAAKPSVTASVFDRRARLLAVFPRTQWYDWPVNGVWLSQPFGFVTPPGASRVVLRLSSGWGTQSWRSVGLYERP